MIRKFDTNWIEEHLSSLVSPLLIAAQTSPKGRGINTLEIVLVNGAEKDALADKMDEISQRISAPFFSRDAQNIRHCFAVILLSTDHSVRGLNCGYCGYACCEEKPDTSPCVFNVTVSTAMQLKLDNRILYSAGKAAGELGFFTKNMPIIFAIPLSVSEKNIFFDRK
jgi:uncharacterized ferredoxin-like protein